MKINKDNIRNVYDAWRILGHLGLVDTIFNHISVLTNDSKDGFKLIMNANGLLATEITKENLCIFPLKKYSAYNANELGVNPDGLKLHSALHLERKKNGVIIHTHSHNSIAVSSYKGGLLPLSQTAIEFVGKIEYIDYNGVFRSEVHTTQLKEFAKKGGIALLKHHGTLIIADSIEEAFYLTYYIEEACKTQVITLSQGGTFNTPNQITIKKAQRALNIDRIKVAKELFEAFRRNLK